MAHSGIDAGLMQLNFRFFTFKSGDISQRWVCSNLLEIGLEAGRLREGLIE